MHKINISNLKHIPVSLEIKTGIINDPYFTELDSNLKAKLDLDSISVTSDVLNYLQTKNKCAHCLGYENCDSHYQHELVLTANNPGYILKGKVCSKYDKFMEIERHIAFDNYLLTDNFNVKFDNSISKDKQSVDIFKYINEFLKTKKAVSKIYYETTKTQQESFYKMVRQGAINNKDGLYYAYVDISTLYEDIKQEIKINKIVDFNSIIDIIHSCKVVVLTNLGKDNLTPFLHNDIILPLLKCLIGPNRLNIILTSYSMDALNRYFCKISADTSTIELLKKTIQGGIYG
jgi:hypothetical protein